MTELVNLYDIKFPGCKSCFACKLKNAKTNGVCAIRDELRRDVLVVTEDVVVSNCYFNTPCQGVRIGCPSDDTIRDAVFRNIEFHGANAIGSQQPRHYLTVGDNGYLKTR